MPVLLLLRLLYAPAAQASPEPGAVMAPATAQRPALRFVPAGQFQMGSPVDEATRHADERPHPVRLSEALWVMQTEVTQAQYKAVVGRQPAFFSKCGPSCPVERINWWEALAFANRLSKAEGLSACYRLQRCAGVEGSGCEGPACDGDFRCAAAQPVDGCTGYRLPTEAEWEHFTRAGTTGPTWSAQWLVLGKNNVPAVGTKAWYGGNSGVDYKGGRLCMGWPQREDPTRPYCGVHPAGQRAANPWGLQDVFGNVWEWCWDWKAPYPQGLQVDPKGPTRGTRRSLRGGAWNFFARGMRAAFRNSVKPIKRDHDVGMRLVRRAPPG